MFDFKKGKASDKVLTEQEIQQKLYGRFLSSKNAIAGASESYTRPAPKTSSSSSSALLFPDENAEDLKPTESVSSELISEARPAERRTERHEPASSNSSKEVFRDRFQTSENDLLKAGRIKSIAPKTSFQSAMPKIQLPKIPFQQMGGAIANVGAIFFSSIFGFFSALSRVVDFRKEGVRTGLAWGSGVVMLVLLLAAIQGLNSNREIAMKTSVPRAPKKVAAKPAQSKAIIPSTLESEDPKTVSSVADRNKTPLTTPQKAVVVNKSAAAGEISKGRFVIQVATYVIRDDANRLLQDLQKIESKSFVKGLSRSSGKTYYSVFLGRFESFQQGQQALAKFKKSDLSRSFKDAFIRTLEA